MRTESGKIMAVCWVLAVALTLVSCTPIGAEAARSTSAQAQRRVTRVLVVGCDRAAALADTVMLVSVDESAKSAHILQIPRDTYAEYTQKSYKKLNGAVKTLGIDGFVSFLEEAMGIPIDCYVMLKPDALVQVVDAIGGVEVDIPKAMRYFDPAQDLRIDLPAGRRVLTGAEAEQFVRYRAGYADADLGRLDAQKQFLSAFAKRCQSLSVMEMIGAALRALTTVQTDIGIHEAVRLCGALRACDTETIPMETLPGEAVQGMSGAWYYVINRAGGARAAREHLLPDEPYTTDAFDPRGVFDREENAQFHAIYQAREEALVTYVENYDR
ncbi:MAG: LCP family protein [Clostridia bacterium]|nr:LCP family protein [Clostridia bacterium]